MKKLSKLLIFLLVFSSFFPLAASIRNLDSAQKTHIGVFEEISPDLHLAQNPYLTETQQGCNDFFQYDAHRPLYVWYFRARYFSDELGRFISRDPLGYVDGYGLYGAYFAQMFGMDPSGTNLISSINTMVNLFKNGPCYNVNISGVDITINSLKTAPVKVSWWHTPCKKYLTPNWAIEKLVEGTIEDYLPINFKKDCDKPCVCKPVLDKTDPSITATVTIYDDGKKPSLSWLMPPIAKVSYCKVTINATAKFKGKLMMGTCENP